MNSLTRLFLRSNVDPLRFFLAASSLLWAVLLALPGATFDRQTYWLMRDVAPELAWAAAHLVHGVVAMHSLFTGRAGRWRWLFDPVLGCLLWTTSGIAMMMSVWPVPAAVAPHIVGAAASWWLLVRYEERGR